jgi:hypothetical protein
MKKIFNPILLIALLSTAITNNIFGMHTAAQIAKLSTSGLCSLTEGFITSMPLLATCFTPRGELGKHPQESNAPESIMHLVTKNATERGIENIKVILDNNIHDYCTNDTSKILYIPTNKALTLELLLNNHNRTEQEEKELNEHIGTIHHELTHNKRNSLLYTPIYEAAIGTVGGITTSALVTTYAKKHLPSIRNNFVLHNSFKFARAGLTLAVAFNLMNMHFYKKYDELQADAGIPNKKELLEALAEKSEGRHGEILKCVAIIKERADYPTILWKKLPDDQFSRKQLLAMKALPTSAFNLPLTIDIVFHANTEHPSDLRRALRFKKRIAELEQKEEKLNENKI